MGLVGKSAPQRKDVRGDFVRNRWDQRKGSQELSLVIMSERGEHACMQQLGLTNLSVTPGGFQWLNCGY